MNIILLFIKNHYSIIKILTIDQNCIITECILSMRLDVVKCFKKFRLKLVISDLQSRRLSCNLKERMPLYISD